MNKYLPCILFFGCILCACSKAKSIEDDSKSGLKGIHRMADTRLRVVSYNGYWTSIFPRDDGTVRTSKWIDGEGIDSEARLHRFAAWAPQAHADIWAMQEVIYSEEDRTDTTAKAIGEYFEKITGQNWHPAADSKGRLILSRFPIIWSGSIKNARGMAALIDLPDNFKDDLLVINLHFYTKPKEVQVSQATNALDFINSVRRGERPEIPEDTPIMICGDFNSLPGDRPYHILAKLAADAREGDGKVRHYHDSKPQQLNSDAKGTYGEIVWSGEVGTSTPLFQMRTIDHILAPKDFLEVQQAFIFNSLILPKETLTRYGVEREAILLQREGRTEKVDHLPVFVDLK